MHKLVDVQQQDSAEHSLLLFVADSNSGSHEAPGAPTWYAAATCTTTIRRARKRTHAGPLGSEMMMLEPVLLPRAWKPERATAK